MGKPRRVRLDKCCTLGNKLNNTSLSDGGGLTMPNSTSSEVLREALRNRAAAAIRARAIMRGNDIAEAADEIVDAFFVSECLPLAMHLTWPVVEAENARLRTENERVQREAGRMLREAEKRIPAAPSWSPEWPTKPGWYWFWGWPSREAKRLGQDKRLMSTDVRTCATGLMSTSSGRFLFEGDTDGLWLPLETPELPEEDG